ncbi:MAG: hypothetical protein WDZ37_05245 [Solirubrobacterales bacterium]
MTPAEPQIERGAIEPALAEEFPSLTLLYCVIAARAGRSPRAVRDQLKHLSDRLYGERAIKMRREPVAHAYRVFFRHIGLDPDESRTPAEALVVERLRAGRFASGGLVEDAVTIATIETGAALRAIDAGAIDGKLGLRGSRPGERLGGGAGMPLPAGTIVVADRRRPLCPLFGELASISDVSRASRRVALCAVGVDGVPSLVVEEGLWKCATIIAAES